jgi:hypothetical protein
MRVVCPTARFGADFPTTNPEIRPRITAGPIMAGLPGAQAGRIEPRPAQSPDTLRAVDSPLETGRRVGDTDTRGRC